MDNDDIIGLVELLLAIRPPIAGLKNRMVYEAIAKASLKDDKLVIVVAKTDNEVVGFNITIIDWKKFWIAFLSRRPVIAFVIVMQRIFARIKSKNNHSTASIETEAIDEYLETEDVNRLWSDSSPQIAKIVYTGVSARFRKMKIATKITDFRFKLLAQKGVNRVDTNLDPNNIAAIRLNHSVGYKIYLSGNRLFASKDL
jgi:ribosomal protein S18 acetylase RimI-like enzyme